VDREVSVVALLCRTSDRRPEDALGAEALALALADQPRLVGNPGDPRTQDWSEDLRESRGCLLEAGGQVDDALTRGALPVLTASQCSIALTTLPVVARHVPDVLVVWLDAHGDFNTPETSASGYLGGMPLAGACGLWDAGLAEERLDPEQVVLCGVRDLDPPERELLEASGVRQVSPAQLADEVRGRRVFVHLDCDVLDPSIMPAQFPAPGGLSDAGLRTLLTAVAESADAVVGVEVTAFGAPELAETVAAIVEPLLR
jgi:arginase